MKSDIEPGQRVFEIVVQDFRHRIPLPPNLVGVHKQYDDEVESIPERTIFRRAKTAERAIEWAKKFGSVISCHKVNSDIRYHLEKIEHLNVVAKPMAIEFTPDDFIIRKGLEVEPTSKAQKEAGKIIDTHV